MSLLNSHSKSLRTWMLGLFVSLGSFVAVGELHAETLVKWSAELAPTPTVKVDPAVIPAALETAPTPKSSPAPPANPRRLAPQSSESLGPANSSTANSSKRKPPSFNLPQIDSIPTAVTGLAIVVGLFLICMWLLRRAGPKPTSPLPADAVAILGRLPLANQSFAQLIQIGNKLVLVGVTADGMTPLTEVTDPAEVDRLLGICQRNHKQSTTAEFQQVLQKLSQEPAKGFLGNEASTAYARASR